MFKTLSVGKMQYPEKEDIYKSWNEKKYFNILYYDIAGYGIGQLYFTNLVVHIFWKLNTLFWKIIASGYIVLLGN